MRSRLLFKSCGRTSPFRANMTLSRWIIWQILTLVSLHRAKVPHEREMDKRMNGPQVFSGSWKWF